MYKSVKSANKPNTIHRRSIAKRVLALLLLFALIISQSGCAQKIEDQLNKSYLVSDVEFYLDTTCQVTIYAMTGGSDEETDIIKDEELVKTAEEVVRGAFDLCGEYESLLSKTIETSDVYKINHSGGKPVTCSPETVSIIQDGVAFGVLSGGSFNIGIGKVMELWDFHGEKPAVPSEKDVEKALAHVYDSGAVYEVNSPITIDGNKVTLRDPEMELDLGGIAKGYIADRIAEYMAEQGVTGGVVDLGGNIVAIGYKSEHSLPTEIIVGIKLPYTESREIVGSVALHDASVVTSGVYERFFEVEGKKYHHVLDPKTGFPVETDLDSVTVVGGLGTSEICDALATTILLNGEEWLKALIEDPSRAKELVGDLDSFNFVLIRTDGSIETLGKGPYTFTELQKLRS